MKKTGFWRGFGAGLILTVVMMGLSVSALAATVSRTIQVEEGVKISLNGATFIPRDVNGNEVSVFLYNGTTYVPLRAVSEAIEGENLNAIVGTLPAGDQGDSDRFREAILRLLHNAYQITEEDFVSAELELVPAGSARDVGFDRGAVAGYGQDDRACAYTSMAAILSAGPAAKTSVALFVDKEEIGSRGNTGMLSQYFVNTLGKMIRMQSGSCTVLDTAQALSNSAALSSDVAAAFDPNYPSISDPRNNAYLGKGVALVKYTGGRGKSNSNDAHAEFVGKVRRIMKKAGVIWQTSELGKVDQGGGGTIAYILADLDMEVMDVGVPLLAMHAPFEVVSKADVYMTVQAYKAFYQG